MSAASHAGPAMRVPQVGKRSRGQFAVGTMNLKREHF